MNVDFFVSVCELGVVMVWPHERQFYAPHQTHFMLLSQSNKCHQVVSFIFGRSENWLFFFILIFRVAFRSRGKCWDSSLN
jgi:hypothetical protein